MGVDYFTCANPNCNYNFPDCRDFNTCMGCEAVFCSDCGNIKSSADYVESKETCMLCRKEAATHGDMIRFLLKKLGLTHEQAMLIFKEDPDE